MTSEKADMFLSERIEALYGKIILSALINDDELRLYFSDGLSARIWDDMQQCCERRYMKCDDDVASLIGGRLCAIEIKKTESLEDECDVHQVCFVEIRTNSGFITISSHNEHNGYYSGFNLRVAVD